MSLEEKKEIFELHKRAFERELNNAYRIESQNGMTFIHYNEVNNISE